MTKHHGIKVGDLVKFKHHIFDEHRPVFLVTEAWTSGPLHPAPDRRSQSIKVHGLPACHRASNFVVISPVE